MKAAIAIPTMTAIPVVDEWDRNGTSTVVLEARSLSTRGSIGGVDAGAEGVESRGFPREAESSRKFWPLVTTSGSSNGSAAAAMA